MLQAPPDEETLASYPDEAFVDGLTLPLTYRFEPGTLQDGVTLTADLPGVRKEDLDIDYREGVLTLTAKVEPPPTHHRLTYQEYEVGGFQRRFTVGERVDIAKIEANLKHGVLSLFLPRAEEHKPRKIEIKA